MDMSFSKLQEIVKDSEAWHSADMTEQLNNKVRHKERCRRAELKQHSILLKENTTLNWLAG